MVSFKRKVAISMIVSHHCFECCFSGELITHNKKVSCPVCNTVNDVWLEGEEPPLNHRQLNESTFNKKTMEGRNEEV